MERYNEYKDSGVQWLGEIPSHWDMQRWRFLLTENKVKNTDCKVKVQLQFKYGDIVRKANQDEDAGVLETISKYTVVAPDDIMINGLNLNYDFISQRVAQVRENGVITSAYVSLRPTSLACSRYYTYFLKSMDFKKMFHGMGTGIRLTLSYNELKNQFIPFPSIAEQQAIADYLDTATAKIDEAIAQQQKMIDLLNERKQIIINTAVTKGLNPSAPMKDSGVDWIGEIPEHWKVMKLKHVTSKIGSGSTPRGGAEVYQDSGIMFLRSQNVYNDGLKLDDVAHIVDGVHQKMKGTQVKYNDILYNITGGSIGRCCCYDREDEANVNQHVSIVRPKGIIAKYLMYNLQSDNAQRQLRETLKGGNREGLAAVTFKEFLILTCPKEEQNQIVSHIERMFVNIDRAISNATKQISLLQERKQIIINDVVTGKVKVC